MTCPYTKPKMSSVRLLAVALLAVMATTAEQNKGGSDFAFDLPDDLEVEMASPFPDKREIVSVVGKILHIAVPKDVSGKDVKGYEVRKTCLKFMCLINRMSGVVLFFYLWLLNIRTDGIGYTPLKENYGFVLTI